MTENTRPAVPGTMNLEDLGTVHRLGLGAVRIVGEGLWDEGKAGTLGLSQATVPPPEAAQQHVTAATAHNRFGLTDRTSRDVLGHATRVELDDATDDDLTAAD